MTALECKKFENYTHKYIIIYIMYHASGVINDFVDPANATLILRDLYDQIKKRRKKKKERNITNIIRWILKKQDIGLVKAF